MNTATMLLFGVNTYSRFHGVKMTSEALVIGLLASLLLVVAIFYFTWRKERYRDKGIFPPDKKFSRASLMEAYIVAAASLVVKDRVGMTRKLSFVNGYLQRNFNDVNDNFEPVYLDGLQRPVSMRSLAHWFNLHIAEAAERSKLVYFLVDLAWYDGELTALEYAAIRVLTAELKLDVEAIEAYMNGYNKSRAQQKSATAEPDSARRKHEAVLGLVPGADKETVKKVYRRLAMIYHPDKFMQETPAVRETAATKFREVQEAYEFLMQ